MTITCRCSTRLCSTLARIARGAVSLPRLRNTAVPGHAREWRLAVAKAVDELAQRTLGLFPCPRDDFAPLLPGRHHRERDDADEQGQPGAVHELGHVRREEHQVHQQEHAASDQHDRQRPFPPGAGVVEEQRGGDRDRARHRHAERVRQRGRAAECEDEDQHHHHQQPVDPRDVDLTDRRRRGVFDPQPRQVAELSRL